MEPTLVAQGVPGRPTKEGAELDLGRDGVVKSSKVFQAKWVKKFTMKMSLGRQDIMGKRKC